MKKKIAILGATSHIAKGLIYNFCRLGQFELFPFARRPEAVNGFLAQVNIKKKLFVSKIEEFFLNKYDVVINCIGIGQPAKLKQEISTIFRLTEDYDNLIINYLKKYPEALYINFSSGAVYGKEFSSPVEDGSYFSVPVNHIDPSYYYGIAKINSELKHRAFSSLNIIDLRIFAYFSRFIELSSNYFVTELILSIINKKEFVTNQEEFSRDYVHPADLFMLINKCINKRSFNSAFDVFSLKPVKKSEILDFFSNEYGLKYVVKKDTIVNSVTGNKKNYYSNYKEAEMKLGYTPKFNSLESIKAEAEYLLKNEKIR